MEDDHEKSVGVWQYGDVQGVCGNDEGEDARCEGDASWRVVSKAETFRDKRETRVEIECVPCCCC